MHDVDVKTLLKTIIWYDGLEDWLGELINELRSCNDTCFRPGWKLIAEGQERAVWEILVQLFGNWGTSVGSGWIEEKEECITFLDEIYQDVKD